MAYFFELPTVFYSRFENGGIEKLKTLNGGTVGRIFFRKMWLRKFYFWSVLPSYRRGPVARSGRRRGVGEWVAYFLGLPTVFYTKFENGGIEKSKTLNGRTVGRIFFRKNMVKKILLESKNQKHSKLSILS